MRGIKKVLGVIIVIAGIASVIYAFMYLESYFLAFLGVMVIIGGGILFKTTTDKEYNEFMKESLRRISNTHGTTFEKLYEDFKDYKTPMGKPWIGSAALNVKQSMVYGPFKEGNYLYVYLKRGKCYISNVGMENIKKNPAEQQCETYSEVCEIYYKNEWLDQIEKMIRNYFENGKIEW